VAGDRRDPHAVVAVPRLPPPLLRHEVRGVLLPRPGRLLVAPVGDRDADAVAGGLEPEVAGLLRGEPPHLLGRRAVAVVAVRADRREDHGHVGGLRGVGDGGRVGHGPTVIVGQARTPASSDVTRNGRPGRRGAPRAATPTSTSASTSARTDPTPTTCRTTVADRPAPGVLDACTCIDLD